MMRRPLQHGLGWGYTTIGSCALHVDGWLIFSTALLSRWAARVPGRRRRDGTTLHLVELKRGASTLPDRRRTRATSHVGAPTWRRSAAADRFDATANDMTGDKPRDPGLRPRPLVRGALAVRDYFQQRYYLPGRRGDVADAPALAVVPTPTRARSSPSSAADGEVPSRCTTSGMVRRLAAGATRLPAQLVWTEAIAAAPWARASAAVRRRRMRRDARRADQVARGSWRSRQAQVRGRASGARSKRQPVSSAAASSRIGPQLRPRPCRPGGDQRQVSRSSSRRPARFSNAAFRRAAAARRTPVPRSRRMSTRLSRAGARARDQCAAGGDPDGSVDQVTIVLPARPIRLRGCAAPRRLLERRSPPPSR
jgi:hypothetical protein